MTAVTPSTKTDSSWIAWAGVETGAKMFVGLSGEGVDCAEAVEASKHSPTRTNGATRTREWFECVVCMSDVAPRLPKRLGLGVVMRRYALGHQVPGAGRRTDNHPRSSDMPGQEVDHEAAHDDFPQSSSVLPVVSMFRDLLVGVARHGVQSQDFFSRSEYLRAPSVACGRDAALPGACLGTHTL